MRRKLYIINNGMKDLRGHYYETSVSIAEASRAAGLQPILAAHVRCPGDIVPPGLEFYACLTTDHWMMEPPPAQPDLAGLRCDRALLAANTIDDLIDGRIGFTEYLDARFVREPGPTQAGKADVDVGSARFNRRAQIKRVAKALLPPVLLKVRHLVKPGALTAHAAPGVEQAQDAHCRHAPARGTPGRGPAAAIPKFVGTAGDAARIRLLASISARSRTALVPDGLHGRGPCLPADCASARAVCRSGTVVEMARGIAPMFHLEFRHSLALAGDGALTQTDNYCVANAAFFEIARTYPFSENVRLYTDSRGLSEEYDRFSGFEFGVLPIPFRLRLLANRSSVEGPLCLGYYGDVRDEKGFHWLPDLIDAMMDDYVRTAPGSFFDPGVARTSGFRASQQASSGATEALSG